MPLPHQRSALELALALVPLVRVLLDEIKHHDRHLADQLKRATSSIALNLAEANGNSGGNRRMRLETARGSTLEALCAVQLAAAWGYVSATEAADVIDGFQRLTTLSRSDGAMRGNPPEAKDRERARKRTRRTPAPRMLRPLAHSTRHALSRRPRSEAPLPHVPPSRTARISRFRPRETRPLRPV